MLNPFKPLELIKAEVFTSMPTQFRNRRRTAWSDPNRQGAEVECFLEGPSFDREGNLWIVDIPFGRIFRISPQKNGTSSCSMTAGPMVSSSTRMAAPSYKLQEGIAGTGPADRTAGTNARNCVQRGF